MAFHQLANLSLGQSSFPALREIPQVYVDKTALIAYLCEPVGAKVCLVRPRRFGKSLLVSTLQALFKHGLRDFKGLAIEKLWQDTGVYRVVWLVFSDVQCFFWRRQRV